MKIYSLNIGVSVTDNNHYQNALVPLPCCTSDANYMNGLSSILGHDKSMLLVNEKATFENVKNGILSYSKEAKKGDLVIITYSGHGSTIIDTNGDEEDGEDQTWCLYDRQIIDDEFRYFWKEFDEGVNVLLIMDSCHSGTAYKSVLDYDGKDFPEIYSPKIKSIKSNEAKNLFINNRELYKPIMNMPLVKEEEVVCSVAGISACQDNEEALAGRFISLFTRLLITTLASKHMEIENYADLVDRIVVQSKELENITPNLSFFGKPTDFFAKNKPFLKINSVYPERMSNVYSDLIFGNTSIINKGLQDNGLIVDVLEDPENNFKKVKDASDFDEITKSDSSCLLVSMKLSKSISHPWDKAYELYDELKLKNISAYIEPDIIPFSEKVEAAKGKTENEYLDTWPQPIGDPNSFTWHLDDDHSQLASARDSLINSPSKYNLNIKIGHIDTGYSPNHPAIPENVQEGISYVKGEKGKPAYEKLTSKLAEQEDHGTATMSILAGKDIDDELFYGTGSNKLGAIPFATVFPIRISETVALTSLLGNSMPFVKAIEKAIEEKCEVITMSMGGLPSRSWAKAINKAYEAGITIVTAAGNSWVKGVAKIAPKKVLYPARFDRVIAAVGVCYNHYPYVADANPGFGKTKAAGGEYMQGNFLPKSAMKTALAAYTPNIAWASFTDKNKDKAIILKNGGGTSSATPQVAAAAALWIVKNKQELIDKGYHGTWKQVEAVRYALFNSGKKQNIIGWKKYYGNGILKANNALLVGVPDETQLKKSKKARVFLGLFNYINVLIFRKSTEASDEKVDKLKTEMMYQEIIQVMEQDPKLIELYQDVDLINMEDEGNGISQEQFDEICKLVVLSPYSSEYLKSILF